MCRCVGQVRHKYNAKKTTFIITKGLWISCVYYICWLIKFSFILIKCGKVVRAQHVNQKIPSSNHLSAYSDEAKASCLICDKILIQCGGAISERSDGVGKVRWRRKNAILLMDLCAGPAENYFRSISLLVLRHPVMLTESTLRPCNSVGSIFQKFEMAYFIRA